MTTTTNHIQKLISVWPDLTLPLRPKEPVPSIVKTLLPSSNAALLILGVTPDYADLSNNVTALDQLQTMIEGVWPGDNNKRRAVLGDWRNMPFDDQSFDIVLGDNSMSLTAFPDQTEVVLSEIKRVLRPGARAIIRWFFAPEDVPNDEEIISFAMNRCDGKLEALRWRLAMHAAQLTPGPSMYTGEAFDLFCRLFPDPKALQKANGWDDKTFSRIHFYRDGKLQLYFPTQHKAHATISKYFSKIMYVESGGYPMSEFGPLVVLDKEQ